MALIMIDKLDAARRQLETAALLYFNDQDIVSIHTLTAAAYEIVESLAQRRGRSTLAQSSLLKLLSDDLAKEVRSAMRVPQNFLKHADRDPDAQLEFEPDFTEFLLLDAMSTYAQITGEIPRLFDVFSKWFAIQKPHSLNLGPDEKRTLLEAHKNFGAMSRSAFLKKSLQ